MAELTLKNLILKSGDGGMAYALNVPDKSFTAAVCAGAENAAALFNTIAGIQSACSGEIILGSRSLNGVEPFRRGIALILKSCALYGHLSVYGNIEAGLKQQGVGCASARSKIEDAARLFGFEDILDCRPFCLTHEQKLRAELGRVLLTNADLVLMHDPLSGLSPQIHGVMKGEILKLYDMLGTSFLYISEDGKEETSAELSFESIRYRTINFSAAS